MNHINITFYLSWLCFLFSLFVFLWTYETVLSHFFPPLLFCLVVKNSFTILLIDTLEVTFFIINLSKCNITWQFNLFLDNARILEYFNICPFPNLYTIVSFFFFKLYRNFVSILMSILYVGYILHILYVYISIL